MVSSGLIIFIDLENKIFGKRNDVIDMLICMFFLLQ
jgi:hypothetical protein